MEAFLAEISCLLQKGDKEQAREMVLRRDTREIKDASLHLQVADLCEQLDLVDETLLELNLVARDDPGNRSVWFRLAEVHQDMGNLEKAARCVRKVVALYPDDPSHYKRLGSLLEEAKEFEEARRVYQEGAEKTQDPSFHPLISGLTFLQDVEVEERKSELQPQNLPTDAHLVRFLTLFSGREGVYARQWVSPSGETGYTPIREPLTATVARNHLLGNHTIGVYQVRIDETVSFIAFDLDLPKYLISSAATKQRQWDQALKKIHQMAVRLVDLGASLEITVHLEDSGFKGRHAWIFLQNPIPARTAKKFAALFLSRLKEPLHEVQMEVFPKQIHVKEGGLGNLIKLPLGIHRRSGKWSAFVSPGGEPFPNQLECLETMTPVSKEGIFKAIEMIQSEGLPVISFPSEHLEEVSEEEVTVGRSAPAVTRAALEYDMERDPQVQHLLSKCETLRSLVENIRRTRELTGEERIVLTHTMGFLEHGPEAVNTLLKQCVNIDPSHFMKSRLKGNPISCPKIRSRIPQITSQVSCNCVFPEQGTLYPNPVNHLATIQTGGAAVGKTVDAMQFETLLQEYLKAKKTMAELRLLLEKYEKQLDRFFEESGVETMTTPWGTLKRAVGEGNQISFELRL